MAKILMYCIAVHPSHDGCNFTVKLHPSLSAARFQNFQDLPCSIPIEINLLELKMKIIRAKLH